jgi:carboxylate-amine ligase
MPPEPSFTLGIEEEFQVVDPETRLLRSHISEMFAEGEKRLKDEIKREMHEAVIEVGTPICSRSSSRSSTTSSMTSAPAMPSTTHARSSRTGPVLTVN